ncbi:MAG: ETX/MTX2 family pore-forming toxin [Paucimonas sp.]|jgi:hypothetical protein|nr:ETX/MTX2 family pore-forming toxin [Paucimonas sp.]
MKGLQTITDAWGEWLAKRCKTSLDFTASTNYDKCSDYEKYIVTAKALRDKYSVRDSRVSNTAKEYKDSKAISNSTNQQVTNDFEFVFNVTNTHRFAVTRALNVGVKVSGGITIPFVTDAKGEVSTELSLSDAKETTKTEMRTLSDKTPIVIPPHRQIIVQASLIIDERVSEWEQPVFLEGYVAIKFSDWRRLNGSEDAHRLWFIPIEQVFGDVFHFNIIDATGYQVVGGGVNAIVQGECTSVYTSELRKELREGGVNDSWDDMKPEKFSAFSDVDPSDISTTESLLVSQLYSGIIPGGAT